MTYRKNAKSFHAEVDTSVNDAFKHQYRKRGQVKNDAATAAIKLWIDLPIEMQAQLLDQEAAIAEVNSSIGQKPFPKPKTKILGDFMEEQFRKFLCSPEGVLLIADAISAPREALKQKKKVKTAKS